MAKFSLDDATLQQIHESLPDLTHLWDTVLPLSPEIISLKFPVQSWIPVASVCLYDALSMLVEARFALHECLAYRFWYLDYSDPPKEYEAVFFAKFFLDDVVLRLYAAGEHLANAIRNMLEIETSNLGNEGKSAFQIRVGKYLAHRHPSHPVTQSTRSLIRPEWKKMLDYRDKWVHEKPPMVAGSGIDYKRHQRWRPLESGLGYSLGFGEGDAADYTIEELLGFIQPSIHLFARTLESIVHFYTDLLTEKGIQL